MNYLRIIATLAWRNLWRNHRRTLVMLAAISIGAWAMIFMTSLMRGMVNDMLRDGISALPGHVQVHHPAYRDDPSIMNLVARGGADIDRAFGAVGISQFAARVRVPAIISSERESRGVTLLGVDPAGELSIRAVGTAVNEGRALESAADTGIVLGRELAEKLETEVGKRVVIMSQDPDNEVADRGFRVVGLFEANLAAQEQMFVFAGRETVQAMLGIGDRVSEVAVLGEDYRVVGPLLEQVRAAIDGEDEVLPWTALDTYLGSMMAVMDGFVLVWVIVIFLALSFGLVNTLVMAVFERVREIGLMLALGMRPASILGQVIVESLLLLVLGLAIGNALAYATVVPLSDGIDISIVAEGMEWFGASSVLYPELERQDVVMANIVVLVLGFLASLSPAWRASRYEPVEAITKV
ncbi:MAG: FtsX-like permease family protein [Gammaproteobacteria bacterium]|nr:FtsX-like permease family protein [Gammaproteobacteria bacterium]